MSVARDAASLAALGLIAPDAHERLDAVAARYAIALTPALAALIDPTDPDDPIAKQFVPDCRELITTDEERIDPIGDEAHSPCEGLVHRYPDRVLLKLVGACAVYCRFCFRREMVGPGRASGLSEAALARAFAYIAARPQIWEVILTGGDPLILAPRRLAEVGARLADLSHVRILRVHTRVPIAAPERIDRPLIAALRAAQKTLYVAIHANHPREITDDVKAACARLTEAGISLVSQTVLLRGVNDRVETLEALMRAFVEAGIKPYYLHHPDLAPGTSHLRITLDEGQALMRQLAARVSGLCQPRYVLDIPGGFGKVAVGPNYLQPIEAGTYTLRDHAGRTHLYPPRNEEA